MNTMTQPTPLTASDRCDRCGAQAFVQVRLLSGGELLFCGHHAREHIDKVRPLAAEIYDFTHTIDKSDAQRAGLV
ncbi:MAG: hypothetical protein E6Q90_02470 [Actinobacteria bacterium]|nr:MAG: hypothetical protein E6Q90_02470 [Actinomycetota bacterium]